MVVQKKGEGKNAIRMKSNKIIKSRHEQKEPENNLIKVYFLKFGFSTRRRENPMKTTICRFFDLKNKNKNNNS